MNDIIEDLFNIYLSCINSYEARFHQVYYNRYTIVDKSMISAYLYIKIIEDMQLQNNDACNNLLNYMLKQVIYSETGNISLEVPPDKLKIYNEILDKLITEKFDFKNRILKKLSYQYILLPNNSYNELLIFLEHIAEYVIFKKMILENNTYVQELFDNEKNTILSFANSINKEDIFYNVKMQIIDLISNDTFDKSNYGKLMYVVLNLKDVHRFSSSGIMSKSENILFHSFTITIMCILLAQYCNRELGETINIYKTIVISLLHDFTEYKGTEIITPFKNYNETTKKMFAEIENSDKNDLITHIGQNLVSYIDMIKTTKEGYISELIDKLAPIMRVWIEVGYIHNYTFISLSHTIYQDRLKRFLRIEKLNDINNKKFFIDFLRECYIYVKEHSLEENIKYTLKFYTDKELNEFRNEIKLLKTKPESFLM